jgi:hypothetical protein
LRGIARILNKIFDINVSFQLISHWLKQAGKIVKEEVSKIEKTEKSIEVLEADESATSGTK